MTLASADLNQDGLLDLVAVPYASGSLGTMDVFFGQADGTLSAPTTYSGVTSNGVAISDLNGDCFPDVVATTDQGVSVFINRGDGTLYSGVEYPATNEVAGVGIGDVNGDGAPDLVLGEFSAGAELLLNRGDGGFGSALALPAHGGFWGGVVVTDLNRDGLADIVMSGGTMGDWVVLLSQGDGGFQAYNYPGGSGGWAGGIAVLDSRGDGAPDLGLADSSVVSIFRNNGYGGFSTAETISLPPGPGVGWIVTGDFNGDCIPDVVVTGWDSTTSGNTPEDLVLYGTADGGFGAPLVLTPNAQLPSGVALLGPVRAPRLLGLADDASPGLSVLGTMGTH